jgi:hypothetical protein
MWWLVIVLIIMGGIAGYYGNILQLGIAVLAVGWILNEGFKTPVPNNPPHVGIETIWGAATGNVLSQGNHLLANYYPFKLDVMLVDVTKYNFRITQTDVTCIDSTTATDGTTTTVPDTSLLIEMTVQMGPDEAFPNLMQYIKSGERKGAEAVLTDVISRIVRDLGTRITADKYMMLALPLSAYIASRITNLPVSYIIDRNKPDTWENREIIHDVFYEAPTADGAQEHKMRLAAWLRDLEERGAGDVHGSGVQIYKFNVDKIDYQNPKVREAVDQRRIESAQRISEKQDAETKALAVKQLEGLSKDALEAYLIMNDKGKLDKQVKEQRNVVQLIGPDGKAIDPSLNQTLLAAGILNQGKE